MTVHTYLAAACAVLTPPGAPAGILHPAAPVPLFLEGCSRPARSLAHALWVLHFHRQATAERILEQPRRALLYALDPALLRPGMAAHYEEAVLYLTRLKAALHERPVRAALAALGPLPIVYGDAVDGRLGCHRTHGRTLYRGQNLIGLAWMQVRTELDAQAGRYPTPPPTWAAFPPR